MKLARNFKLTAGIDPAPVINIFFLIFMFYIFYPHALDNRVFNINTYTQSAKTGVFYDAGAVLTIKKNGSVLINENPAEWNSLGVKMKELYIRDSNVIITVKGDKSAPLGRIIDTMNILRLAGIKRILLDAESE